MLRAFLNVCYVLQAIILIAAVASCTSSNNVVDINSGDSVSFTTLQASFATTENKEAPRIKVRHTESGDAMFAQTIPSGMVADIGDNIYSGPTFISGSFNLSINSIGIGVQDLYGEGARIGWYLGMGQVDMDFLISESGIADRTQEDIGGLYYEIVVYKDFMPRLSGKIGLSGISGLSSSMDLVELDVGLAYELFPHVEIIAGKYIWSFEYSTQQYDSSLALDLEGPYIGFNIFFE